MYLTEQHIIKKNNPLWKQLDSLCFLSKNLYNVALYRTKLHYKETGKFLRAYDLNKLLVAENNVDFRALPPNTSQMVVMLADQNHRSFFQSIKKFGTNKDGYNAPPKPPKFKHKTKGRCVASFSYQHARVNKKDGLVHLPKKCKIPHLKTKATNIKEVRIVPRSNCYVIEIVYKKETNDLNLNKNNVASIDLGVNNLCAVTVHQQDSASQPKSFLINGRPIKSMNQFYNKKRASLLCQVMKQNSKRRSTRATQKLDLKRSCKIKNYFHHASKYIIEFCKQNDIGRIVIGKNDGWKQKVNMGKRNNQNFSDIPYDMLVQQLKYKAEMVGIEVVETDENYTSKCSALDLEQIQKRDEYKGSRVKRGLFKTSTNITFNADINASLNILRKVIGDGFLQKNATFNRGYGHYPVLVNPTRRFILV